MVSGPPAGSASIRTAPAGGVRHAHPWTPVHLGTLAVAAVVLFWANRGQYFFGDDWEFLVNRGFVHPVLDVFATHNEHWSTVPVTVYVVLRNVFGLSSTAPFVVVLVAVHLLLTHLLWRVCRRAGVPAAVATTAAAVFAVFGAGGENLLWTFQIGFLGSIAAGWAAVLLADRPSSRPGGRDLGAALVLTVGVACSGIGVPAVGLCVLVVWSRSRSLARSAVVGGVPTAAFLLWYLTAGSIEPDEWYAVVGRQQPEVPGAAWDQGPVALARFVVRAVLDTAGAATGLPPVPVAVLVAALAGWALLRIVGLVRGRPGSAAAAAPVAGLVAAGAFFVLSGFGRTQTDASRYVYVAVGFALPGATLALWQLARLIARRADRRVAPALAVLVLLPVLAHNLVLLDQRARTDGTVETAFRSVVLGAAALVAAGEPVLAERLDPVLNPDLSTAHLAALTAAGDLPADVAGPADILRARLALQVVVSFDSPGQAGTGAAPSLSSPTAVHDVKIQPTDAGCLRATSETEQSVHLVLPGGPTRFSVMDPPQALVLTLTADGLSTSPRVVPVPAGTPVEVQAALPAGQVLSLVVPAAGLVLCGVR